MTVPYENILSLRRTRNFLRELSDPKKTPGIPSCIRKEAMSCMRHMPGSYQDEDILNGILNGKAGSCYKNVEDCGFEEDTFDYWKNYVPEPARWWDRKVKQ
ncbi:MAG: hypothetical protein H8D80_00085 [Proteobacteria bacterium]|nr:hypothetical protein [Pseudomonadota bacterium]